MTERDKVTVEDITGIVHTDETTNSVEEVRKLRGRENKTEKRFILVEYVNKGLFIQDNANDETQYFQGSKASLEKVVDLLNSLNGENEQLKKDCTVLIYHNQEYRKENEQLKDRIDNYNTAFKKLQDLTERKINENEQLKKELESFKPIIFESDGKPVTLYKKGDVE